ncbi:MAG: TIGR00730 family Rossman fold protein [Acidimicrobiales bacterium]|nr:TIGR00730 family Rossman fold protein [Hyphomonadaceae bacterium]RZV41226.1 MAG: TIGR00730 family Rossman fold protein [Acidimicrobiales bacterium]
MTETSKVKSELQNKSICVFCGASKVVDEDYYDLARTCGTALAERKYRLVYGGGGVGLMGTTAIAAHEAGGKVLGIIPEFLTEIEDVLTSIEHRIVDNMHDRKHQMYEESDAFIVLPGGIGTLEETIEVISWLRLHLHSKPIVFLDHDGYWTPLVTLLMHTIEKGFSPAWVKEHIYHVHRIDDALQMIEAEWANPSHKGNIQMTDIDLV